MRVPLGQNSGMLLVACCAPCTAILTVCNILSQVWRRLSKAVLRPDHPFALHKLLFAAAYDGWDAGGD